MTQTCTLQRSTTVCRDNKAIDWQSKRIVLLYYDERSGEEFWDALEYMQENVVDHEGQFISLDLTNSQAATLPEMFYAALKNVRWESSLPFRLPVILQHNPHVASSFINHAILWQRLCDLLIIDDEPNRKTVLVLENIDQASPISQHEAARLIRFHATHALHRTLVFTLNRHHEQIISELQNIFA